ncbi:MAG: 3-oxoacyl-[acyl-carrier-protein] reductase [Herpetosiphon sp.]
MNQQKPRVALVTGGGRGIGRSVAIDLARQGFMVGVAARTEAEVAAVGKEIEKLGQRAAAVTVNLDDDASREAMLRQVESQLGPIDVLVNNAALVGPYGPTWELDPAEWLRALNVNLGVPFLLTRAVLPHMMKAGWGRIINVSSGAARNPMERAGAYSVTKAGLDMLSRQIGTEVEGTGVVSISVYPGVVDTAMQTEIREQPSAVVGEDLASRFRSYYESGRLQQPERPARLIALLAGEMGNRFNGQIVDIYSAEIQTLLQEAE